MPSIRNIIIFISIGAVVVLGYVFFIRGDKEPAENLVTTSAETLPGIVGDGVTASSGDSKIAQDFLNLLLSVKNIKLDDSIFSEVAWSNLKDSSIELLPDGNEGRQNPFAPLGSDPIEMTMPVLPPAEETVPPPAPAGTTTPPAQTPPTGTQQ